MGRFNCRQTRQQRQHTYAGTPAVRLLVFGVPSTFPGARPTRVRRPWSAPNGRGVETVDQVNGPSFFKAHVVAIGDFARGCLADKWEKKPEKYKDQINTADVTLAKECRRTIEIRARSNTSCWLCGNGLRDTVVERVTAPVGSANNFIWAICSRVTETTVRLEYWPVVSSRVSKPKTFAPIWGCIYLQTRCPSERSTTPYR